MQEFIGMQGAPGVEMWNLEGSDVTWQMGSFQGNWSPSMPGAGTKQTFGGQCFSELAQVGFNTWHQVPPGPPDLYVRHLDLIATYQQPGGDELRTQLQWSLFDHSFGAGLDLVVSVQTNRLHSSPTANIGSRLPAGAVVYRLHATDPTACWPHSENDTTVLLPGCILVRVGSHLSYVEMIHPADCANVVPAPFRVRQELSAIRTEFRVFSEPLEKGVIRRVRWRSIWLPRESDAQGAHEAYRHFLQQPIPLTT